MTDEMQTPKRGTGDVRPGFLKRQPQIPSSKPPEESLVPAAGTPLLHLSLAGRPQLFQLLLLFRRQHLH